VATLSRRRQSAADSDPSPPKLTVRVISRIDHASKTQIQPLLEGVENSRCDRLRLALPASMGRVSTLGRERLVALSRALPSESVSSRSIFNRPLSPNRSNLAVLCRHGSHLVGQRPSTGLPARRKHGWSAAHIPRSFAMGCGVTLSKHTFADDLAVSVGVPAVPLAAVASRNGRDSRPP